MLAFIIYPLFKKLRESFKIEQETCFCLGEKVIATVPKHVATKEEFVNSFSEFSSAVKQLLAFILNFNFNIEEMTYLYMYIYDEKTKKKIFIKYKSHGVERILRKDQSTETRNKNRKQIEI